MSNQFKEGFKIFIMALIALLIFLGFIFGVNSVGEKMRDVLADPGVTVEMAPVVIKNVVASWYDSENCLGCREDRLMKNGRVLDGAAFTCAYNYAPLGTMLVLRVGEKTAVCEVTDRIGRDERIDLTPAVFERLASLDQGLVKVEIINKK